MFSITGRENIYVIAASAASRKTSTDFGNSEGNGTNENEEGERKMEKKRKKNKKFFFKTCFFPVSKKEIFLYFFMVFRNKNTLFRTDGVRLRHCQGL